MCVELPILKRCCCCVPLRTGLAVMGIVKMIILASTVIYGIYDVYCGGDRNRIHCFSYEHTETQLLYGLYFFLVVIVIDVLFTAMMLWGVYLRHAKLLIISYYYTILMTAICSLISGIILAWQIYIIATDEVGILAGIILVFTLLEIAALIVILIFQFYLFLLIRGVIYEVTGEINLKFWKSAADNQSLIAMESTDKSNVAYISTSKDV